MIIRCCAFSLFLQSVQFNHCHTFVLSYTCAVDDRIEITDIDEIVLVQLSQFKPSVTQYLVHRPTFLFQEGESNETKHKCCHLVK